MCSILCFSSDSRLSSNSSHWLQENFDASDTFSTGIKSWYWMVCAGDSMFSLSYISILNIFSSVSRDDL